MMYKQNSTYINNPEPFQNGQDHLMAELKPVRDFLEKKVHAMIRRFETEIQSPFRGYGITPSEAMEHIQRAKNNSFSVPGKDCFIHDDSLNKRIELSRKSGIKMPLFKLQHLFGLSKLEMTLFLTCLLPEFFPGFHRIFGFLQDDATLSYPTIGFLMEIYCKDQPKRERIRRIFHSGSPLMSWHILVAAVDDKRIPPLHRSYRVDERIVSYLMGGYGYDGSLEKYILLEDIEEPSSQLTNNIEAQNIINTVEQGKECAFVSLAGTDRDAAIQFIKHISMRLGWRLIKIPFTALYNQKGWNQKLIDVLLREAILQPAGILIYEESLVNGPLPEPGPLLRQFARKGTLVFFMSQARIITEGIEPTINYIRIEFNTPPAIERFHFWQKAAADGDFNLPDEVSEQLAMRYPLSENQIYRMFDRLKLRLNGNKNRPDRILNMFTYVFNDYSLQPLEDLAQKIEAMVDWNDLVVHRSLADHLKAFRNTVAHQFTVYEKWGLGKKDRKGHGAVALFSGPSGTGKTMAAEVIAHDLGINLYRVDLAGIVSKYIGETEKNLQRIFHGARGSNTLLFFDEADALFGKRTDIHDSHDRYANLEVNYLLQKLEEHDGPVLLATNRRKNIDEAFLRRIHFIIEFPQPSESLRQIIWQKKIPDSIQRSDDVDIPLLAKQFEISGGDIKNAALQAIFMAAESGAGLNMNHLLTSLRREYLKLGKHFPGSQLNHLKKNVFESADTRRRKKEVKRFGSGN